MSLNPLQFRSEAEFRKEVKFEKEAEFKKEVTLPQGDTEFTIQGEGIIDTGYNSALILLHEGGEVEYNITSIVNQTDTTELGSSITYEKNNTYLMVSHSENPDEYNTSVTFTYTVTTTYFNGQKINNKGSLFQHVEAYSINTYDLATKKLTSSSVQSSNIASDFIKSSDIEANSIKSGKYDVNKVLKELLEFKDSMGFSGPQPIEATVNFTDGGSQSDVTVGYIYRLGPIITGVLWDADKIQSSINATKKVYSLQGIQTENPIVTTDKQFSPVDITWFGYSSPSNLMAWPTNITISEGKMKAQFDIMNYAALKSDNTNIGTSLRPIYFMTTCNDEFKLTIPE